MTPALKPMVEAMLAEVRRQNALDCTVSDPPPTGTIVFVNGVVDLEKVARAGLLAIREEPRDDLALDLFPGLSRKRWRGAIDAILKETP